MDIDRIVSELREKAEGPLRPSPMATPDDLMRWGVDNENLDDMLDAVSLRVARRYLAGDLTFEIANAMTSMSCRSYIWTELAAIGPNCSGRFI